MTNIKKSLAYRMVNRRWESEKEAWEGAKKAVHPERPDLIDYASIKELGEAFVRSNEPFFEKIGVKVRGGGYQRLANISNDGRKARQQARAAKLLACTKR
jgi:hypothetical protein